MCCYIYISPFLKYTCTVWIELCGLFEILIFFFDKRWCIVNLSSILQSYAVIFSSITAWHGCIVRKTFQQRLQKGVFKRSMKKYWKTCTTKWSVCTKKSRRIFVPVLWYDIKSHLSIYELQFSDKSSRTQNYYSKGDFLIVDCQLYVSKLDLHRNNSKGFRLSKFSAWYRGLIPGAVKCYLLELSVAKQRNKNKGERGYK